MLTIDGSTGEGGGQILRTSLALSIVTGRAFRMEQIRARRKKPGLLNQHLTAVRAAAEISNAELHGAELHSRELSFTPGPVRGGHYDFQVGTAGSAGLVLQTVLPALLTAAEPSRLSLGGGTHNPSSPPFDFLARAYLPLVSRMGPRVTARLWRPGFFPAGGGRFEVEIAPGPLKPLSLLERGEVRSLEGKIYLARIPRHVAEREQRVLEERFPEARVVIEEVERPIGPGNAVVLECECEHVTEVFTGFAERGVRAEDVAGAVVTEAQQYLKVNVPIGEHLADQLMLLLALAGGGEFRTMPLTAHAVTQQESIRRFLEVAIHADPLADGSVRVRVERTD